MSLQFREMTSDDRPLVVTWMDDKASRAFAGGLDPMVLPIEGQISLIAERGGLPVGLGLMDLDEGRAWPFVLTAPRARGQRIASEVLGELERRSSRRTQTLIAEIETGNTAAERAVISAGFAADPTLIATPGFKTFTRPCKWIAST